MIEFILNDQDISTDVPAGMTVLDFVRYRQDLKGTKIGCREGDCGACTILVGEPVSDRVRYRSMTSCLMPIANAAGKHIVTIEGINPSDGSLTPVQQALIDESGTQCGFCTVGFVMSLTSFCLDNLNSPTLRDGAASPEEAAVSAIDGNICRCTGYKSIERAADRICKILSEPPTGVPAAVSARGVAKSAGGQFADGLVPLYFRKIADRLTRKQANSRPPEGGTPNMIVGGGTDVYVQRPDAMVESGASHVFYDDALRGIRELGDKIEIGASATVTDLLESPLMHSIFPDLYKHLKLISSTPIRNMATLAGNFINASPIGDMTVWFLALDSEIELSSAERASSPTVREAATRTIKLRNLYLGYKQLTRSPGEYITTVLFKKPKGSHYFNFEKVSKRTYLDIATVNTAISLTVDHLPGPGWIPPVLAEPDVQARGPKIDYFITNASVAAGGVAPIPLYLKETSSFLIGRRVDRDTIEKAAKIIDAEISPISDVRGTEEYKRLLLRQLFRAHFFELFGDSAI
ncbi:MAG: FAD binding domain-containing protein [Acidobacteriota bacterium]